MEKLISRMFTLWVFAYGVVNGAYINTKQKTENLFQPPAHLSRPMNTNFNSDPYVENYNPNSNDAKFSEEGINDSENTVDKTLNDILGNICIGERKIRSQDFSNLISNIQSADIDGDKSSKYKDVFGGGASKTDLHRRVKRY